MTKKFKLIILTGLLLALGIIIWHPGFLSAKPKYKAFSVTPNPKTAFQQAMQKNRPVFLEFYAAW